jgi:hypothetical protein
VDSIRFWSGSNAHQICEYVGPAVGARPDLADKIMVTALRIGRRWRCEEADCIIREAIVAQPAATRGLSGLRQLPHPRCAIASYDSEHGPDPARRRMPSLNPGYLIQSTQRTRNLERLFRLSSRHLRVATVTFLLQANILKSVLRASRFETFNCRSIYRARSSANRAAKIGS